MACSGTALLFFFYIQQPKAKISVISVYSGRGIQVMVKKSDPATRHGGVWGERRYRSCSFLTSALDGCEWSASGPSHALPPGKGLPVPIGLEAGWASEPVWTQRLEEKSSASVGDRTPVVQSVVRHKTD
jgi:hypothetical protein